MAALQLWHKAAVLIVAPLVLEIVMLAAIKEGQDQVNAAQEAERASAEVIFYRLKGIQASLVGISDSFNYRASGKQWPLYRCQRSLTYLKEIHASLLKEADFKDSPLDHVMQEVRTLMQDTINDSRADVHDLQVADMKTFPQISKLASKAMKACEATQEQWRVSNVAKVAEVRKKQEKLNQLLLGTLLSSGLFAITLGAFFHRGTISQINGLMENISRLARREPLLPALRGSNELAKLDQVFHSMARDIESLNERERSVLVNSNELILLINSDLKIELASHSIYAILGIKEDEIVGLRVSEISPDFASELESAKQHEQSRFELSFANIAGEAIELEVSTTWSEAEQHFYCVAHDIGARKELERMKQSFIAMVSHDLRSPISASQAALELLKSDSDCAQLSKEGLNLVDRMGVSNTRLLGLITDLLDIEKLDYGLITLDYELVTFNDLVSESLTAVQTLASAKNIKIDSDDSDRFVYCDSARIIQVLINIISNAIKVSPSSAQIELRFNQEGGYSKIAIIDHGPGISAEFMPHLFDRYSQSTDKELAKQGSGLGLSVAKKLVELHHGEIIVKSGGTAETARGATFIVKLPDRQKA